MDQPTTENLTLWYFGTDASTAGHYFHTMGEKYMQKSRTWFNDWPFNPETVANKPNAKEWSSDTGLKRGDAKFFQIDGHSIWYVEGSAADSRSGTKSVWWVKKLITKQELKEIILANEPSRVLIAGMKERMKFEINWDYEDRGNV